MVCSRIAVLVMAGMALAALAASGSPPASPSGPAPGPAPEAVPISRFDEEIKVGLVRVVVRAVDGAGNTLLGLTPEDFRVRVGKREVPVAAVDWAGAAPAPAAPTATADVAGTAASAAPAEPPGKLVVVFVEADNNSPPRVRGHLRTLPFTRKILDSLAPAALPAAGGDVEVRLRRRRGTVLLRPTSIPADAGGR